MNNGNGRKDPTDKMVDTLEDIAKFLERLLTGIYWCAGLLALVAFLILLRIFMEL